MHSRTTSKTADVPEKVTSRVGSDWRIPSSVFLRQDPSQESFESQASKGGGKEDQSSENCPPWHVGDRWRYGRAQALTHIDDGVEANGDLQPANSPEAGPSVIHTSQKGNGHNNDGKNQANLLGIDG